MFHLEGIAFLGGGGAFEQEQGSLDSTMEEGMHLYRSRVKHQTVLPLLEEEVHLDRNRVKHQRVLLYWSRGTFGKEEGMHLNRSRVKHQIVLLLLEEGSAEKEEVHLNWSVDPWRVGHDETAVNLLDWPHS